MTSRIVSIIPVGTGQLRVVIRRRRPAKRPEIRLECLKASPDGLRRTISLRIGTGAIAALAGALIAAKDAIRDERRDRGGVHK